MSKRKVIKNVIICFIFIIIANVLYTVLLPEIFFKNKEISLGVEAADIELGTVSVILLENGTELQRDDGIILANLSNNIGESNIIPGKIYQEKLEIKNSGTIEEYVRVAIRKYWKDNEGNKTDQVSPDFIELKLVQEGWIIDEKSSSEEQIYAYYTRPIMVDETIGLSETFRILPAVSTDMDITATKDGENTIINTKRTYDEYSFCLEVRVDVVQNKNAEEAILATWGREVSITDGILSLK